MSDVILAIDAATATGWAAGAPGVAVPRWGLRRFDGQEGGRGAAISRFRAWLLHLCKQLQPTLILSEAPYIPRFSYNPKNPFQSGPPINPNTLRLLLPYNGEIEAVAWELDIPWQEKTPNEISKFFTGRANWKREHKKRAYIAVCGSYGWHVDDDNIADALGLWTMGEAMLSPVAAQSRGDARLFAKKIPGDILAAARSPKPRKSQGQAGLFD